MSDDMEMKAVRGRYPVEHQMDKAVSAGVDAFWCAPKPIYRQNVWKV